MLILNKKNVKEIKESDGILENITFVGMESSKLINYSTNMCGSGQGPKVVNRCTIFSSPRWMVILLQHH
jgi:hypothetical protein